MLFYNFANLKLELQRYLTINPGLAIPRPNTPTKRKEVSVTMADTVLMSKATIEALDELNRAQEARKKIQAEIRRLSRLPREESGCGVGPHRTAYSDACDHLRVEARIVERAEKNLLRIIEDNKPPHIQIEV